MELVNLDTNAVAGSDILRHFGGTDPNDRVDDMEKRVHHLQVLGNGSGIAYLSWEEQRKNDSTPEVFLQRARFREDSLSSLASAIQLEDANDSYREPHIALSGDNIVWVWKYEASDGNGQIQARLLDSSTLETLPESINLKLGCAKCK